MGGSGEIDTEEEGFLRRSSVCTKHIQKIATKSRKIYDNVSHA